MHAHVPMSYPKLSSHWRRSSRVAKTLAEVKSRVRFGHEGISSLSSLVDWQSRVFIKPTELHDACNMLQK